MAPRAKAPTAPTTTAKPVTESIWTRKLDLLYCAFFYVHIAAMLLVDLTPLYPLAIKPAFLTTLREWYITTYQDQFFTSPPAWFAAFMWMEAVYHLPLSIWAVGALRRDDPLVPVHLLVYAVQTAMTTLTCIVDFLSWNVETKIKTDLSGLYGPYMILSLIMGVDMSRRLNARILRSP